MERLDANHLSAVLARHRIQQAENLALFQRAKFDMWQAPEGAAVGLPQDDDPEEGAEVGNPGAPAQIFTPSGRSQPAGIHPGPWGGHPSGAIPLSAMTSIAPNRNRRFNYNGFFWLRPDAAAAWLALMERARGDGMRITVTSAYRSIEHQVSLQSGGRAAKPGKSPHNYALAVDIGQLYVQSHAASASARMRQTPLYQWMFAVAPSYGWINPGWARDGRGMEEPWHWEFWGVK